MPYLKDAVASALSQHYENLEVVVVENASTDKSAQWLHTQSDPRLSVVYRTELQSAALNWTQAVHESSGEYVKLLCADDLLDPEIVADQVAALQAQPTAWDSLTKMGVPEVAQTDYFVDADTRQLILWRIL